MAVPSCTEDYTRTVANIFASAIKGGGTGHYPHTSPYIDQGLATFLEFLQTRSYSSDGNTHPPALLQSVYDFISAATIPYLSNVAEIIDEQLHQEFISHLYKVFALLCGVNVANSYLASAETVDWVLSEMRARLVGGV